MRIAEEVYEEKDGKYMIFWITGMAYGPGMHPIAHLEM